MKAHHIIEIKARCEKLQAAAQILLENGARFEGEDRQLDTYFRVPKGRLKLREGRLENFLIAYRRPDKEGPKHSSVRLYPTRAEDGLGAVLGNCLPVWVQVEKTRRIYWADNVKIHLDEVTGLGRFLEIEAIDLDGSRSLDQLQAQCRYWMERLQVRTLDLIDRSYSDLIRNDEQ